MRSFKAKIITILVLIAVFIISITFYAVTNVIAAVLYGDEDDQVVYESQPGTVIASPYYISAAYGVCGCEAYVCNQCHYGIDLVSTAATPSIYAYADGEIINNGYDYAGAVMVEILHSNNVYTWYIHMQEGSTNHLKVGEKIKKGDYIGLMGSTGYSTGAHLHFQMNINCNNSDCSVNPAPYLNPEKDEGGDAAEGLDIFGVE